MSSPPLRRLLYISTARQPIDGAMRESVLRVSRRNNAAAGISGLLVTGQRRFLQVLEGNPETVDASFARIERDPRHFAVVILGNTLVNERAFGQWTMGHYRAETAAGVAEDLASMISQLTDPTLRAYFEGFLKAQARAA